VGYRNVIIQSPAKLSLKQNQLVLSGQEQLTIPLEDINCLLIENQQTVLTAALLSALAEHGVAVLICNSKHMPNSVVLPYSNHSRQLEIFQRQTSLTRPAAKRLWKQIVQQKINNQAACLALLGDDKTAKELTHLSKTVQSGDAKNVEATAAQIYFPALFGTGFYRNAENHTNACLNYGYAILRANLARSLAVYGFLPCLGIHHRSKLNQFNLADDFIEPFRPLVDLFVATYEAELVEAQPYAWKQYLLQLLSFSLIVDGKRQSASYAMELAVKSFTTLLAGYTEELSLPELAGLQMHRYE
jgi:CRISPR-associated protein Cas1